MNLAYKQEGDHLLPDLEIPDQPEGDVGAFGQMRQTYLKEEKRVLFEELLTTGKLKAHLMEVDKAAAERMDLIMQQMMEAENVTEALKAKDPMGWAAAVGNIQSRAREIVMQEIVYS